MVPMKPEEILSQLKAHVTKESAAIAERVKGTILMRTTSAIVLFLLGMAAEAIRSAIF